MMSKIIKFLLVVFLIAAIEYLGDATDVITAEAGERIKVVDGDSLEIGRRRIRLLGIDSPEYRQYCYDKHHRRYSCGIKARQHMEKLVAAGSVECREKGTDRYKRSLCVCYSGEKDLNEEMVRSGWAVVYRDEGAAYADAQKEAKKHRRGIWQGKFMRPELYRFLNK